MRASKSITTILLLVTLSCCISKGSFKGNGNVLNELVNRITLTLIRNYELSNSYSRYQLKVEIRDVICIWDENHNMDLSIIEDNEDMSNQIENRIDSTCKTGLMKFVVDKLSGVQDIYSNCYIETRKRVDSYNPFDK